MWGLCVHRTGCQYRDLASLDFCDETKAMAPRAAEQHNQNEKGKQGEGRGGDERRMLLPRSQEEDSVVLYFSSAQSPSPRRGQATAASKSSLTFSRTQFFSHLTAGTMQTQHSCWVNARSWQPATALGKVMLANWRYVAQDSAQRTQRMGALRDNMGWRCGRYGTRRRQTMVTLEEQEEEEEEEEEERTRKANAVLMRQWRHPLLVAGRVGCCPPGQEPVQQLGLAHGRNTGDAGAEGQGRRSLARAVAAQAVDARMANQEVSVLRRRVLRQRAGGGV